MSTVKTKKVQLGTDATASNNFTLYQPATPDGTLRVGVGNADSPIEVGQFNANGYKPATAPAFSAQLSGNQTISAGTWTKAQFSIEQFDTNSNYDNSTNYRFTPTVAGYYLINVNARFAGLSGSSNLMGTLYVNGARTAIFQQQHAQTDDSSAIGANLLYLNGSTDYVECYVYTNNGDILISAYTFFQGYLVQQA